MSRLIRILKFPQTCPACTADFSMTFATTTGGGHAPDEPFVDVQTLNQAREIVSRLFNQSRILDKCHVRVAQAVSKAVSKRSTQLFQPFTTYISNVSNAVDAWRRNVTLIRPEMAHCDYDTYKTNGFFWKTTGPQYSSRPALSIKDM